MDTVDILKMLVFINYLSLPHLELEAQRKPSELLTGPPPVKSMNELCGMIEVKS